MSANGFVERGRWGLDWHQADDAEFGAFAVEQLDAVGTLLFGRATCEGTASFWPTPEAIAADPEVAGRMNALPEVVFSSTLARADWENTRPVRGDAAEEVAALRRQPGEDAIVLGSSDLAASLAARGLIDEVEIQLVPLLLGGGTRLFDNFGRSDLRLEPVRAIEGPGVTHLTYRVIARPRPAAWRARPAPRRRRSGSPRRQLMTAWPMRAVLANQFRRADDIALREYAA